MPVDPQETRTGQTIPPKGVQATAFSEVEPQNTIEETKDNIAKRYRVSRWWVGVSMVFVGILSAINAIMHECLDADSIALLYNTTAILWLALVGSGIITAYILGSCKGVIFIGLSISVLPIATLLRNWFGFEISLGVVSSLQVSVIATIILLVIGLVLKFRKDGRK